MIILLAMGHRPTVSLQVFEEHHGTSIPLAKVEGRKGVVLRSEGGKTRYCYIDFPEKLLSPEDWRKLQDRYSYFQGTDLPIYRFIYRTDDFVKRVEVVGPPDNIPLLKEVFRTLNSAPCGPEVKPKKITLSWREVFSKRKAPPLGEYEPLLGKTELKGKDYELGLSMLHRFGYLFFTGIVFVSKDGRSWLVKGKVEL
ncbi:MAG: hypothetical protein GXO39_05895 [Thermotogae bacterium]|nr:hypothetical protein [Thermotogota bacterium]